MANFIQQFNAGGITYDLHDSEFIIDTRTASGAALTGETKAAALFDGMQITFWMNYAAASNATLNLTLADGTTTGAIPCYYSGTTRLGTHYAAGNAVHFTYRENVTIGTTTITHGWWGDANYSVSDTNYDIIGTSIPIKTRLNAYCLCGVVGTSGTIAKQTNTAGAGTYWEINAFTQSSGTGTSKKLVPNQGYYPGKIFYYTGSSAITDADSVSGTISGGTSNVDLRYTVNGSTSANIGVTGAPFFLVGSLGSDGLFYPNGHDSQATKEWWQCGFPTDLTSTYIYWYVGMMSSKYQCRLSDTNWMLKSDGTKWIVFDGAMSSGVSWNDITGKPTEFTPASHTHGYIGNDGSVAPSVSASPASGDKILISDLTDSNKVKGGPEIGSNDGKYLRHDGAWDTPDDHILVMTGTPTGALDSAPITTTTAWGDYTTAITNHDRLVLDIPLAHSRIEFQAQRDDGSTVNVLYAITHSGQRIVTSASYEAESDANGLVVFTKDASTVSFSEFAGEVNWSGVLGNPYPLNAPSTDGNYSLNVSGGTTSWTTASGGPDTPDAPASDGNYVLNVDSGSSSWQEDTTLETFLFDGSEEVAGMGTCATCSTKTWDDLMYALTYKQVQVKSSVGSLVLTNYEIVTQSGVEGVFSLMVPAIGAGNVPAIFSQFAIVHIGQTLYMPLQLLAFQVGQISSLNDLSYSTYIMPSLYVEHGLLGISGNPGTSFDVISRTTNRIIVWPD